MKRILRYVKARFSEYSTWSTLFSAATSLVGCFISPDHAQLIIGGLISVLTGIGILTPEERR